MLCYVNKNTGRKTCRKHISGNGNKWEKYEKGLRYKDKNSVEKSVDNVDNLLANYAGKKLCKVISPGCAPGYGKSSVANVKKFPVKILKIWD